MVAVQADKNYGDEWDLTWFFWWEFYTSAPTLIHSQNSVVKQKYLD